MKRMRIDRADVVIVGAGIMGLSIAYNLARLSPQLRILVLEQSYLCSGASGRNGGGVRAQWGSPSNIQLMQKSLELFRQFAKEHSINTWLRQGGYLFLVRNQASAEMLAKNVELQRELGLNSELVLPNALGEMVPGLSNEGVALASYNPDDCVVFPWPFVWGYARSAQQLGVQIETFTEAFALDTNAGAISGVMTNRGHIQAGTVVLACGALSPGLARTVNVDLPTHPQRHEICSSEPLKPWLTPLVADLSNGLYFSQSTRGEIVGGISSAAAPTDGRQTSSWQFLARYSAALAKVFPRLGAVRILRQWAGLYDISPDHNPIVGSVDECPGLQLASGFMGHGFMMAPAVGELVAEGIAGRARSEILARWNLRRFKEGNLLSENMIIG